MTCLNRVCERAKQGCTVIKQLDSKIVYKNKWMSVREDRVLRPSGAEGIYGVVDKPDCAAIIAIDNGFIHLVQQYRYTVQERCWEIPQGAWESSPDANHLDLAKGELREETGLDAASMTYLGAQFIAYGFLNQTCHVYLATFLTQKENQLDSEEEDLITRAFPVDEFERMIIDNDIKDCVTISAYGLAKLKGLV
ncbi:ADP-ribose pyrophosphatase [Enterovibrio norvegicus]|uniref:NUDIX domain-containing protein n=2 Tax=Enterovibrio norvegicus TaxID=188144 RepID=UPI000684566D|nr:NUDIX hydrolase [Enterovibrio norvegicus]OEE59520.1 ADP-ribose pyrophosphatase [Enterovibrio norvegicus]PMH66015.1 ADP-ribose pyrophosphatase [Enterovibrio norvegicus]PMI30517.1 ADP-ribose pyrophosphatase [Enterovibrio norvegicus]PMI38712.1 ADP-ribose pyrophosphatase [Enterovibrio norvegicus]PMN51991.1 ADP-ribose pyrophosphatase [Enterovibrio norvegicus]